MMLFPFFSFTFFLMFFIFFVLPIVIFIRIFKSNDRGHRPHYNHRYNNHDTRDPIIPARATVIYKRGQESFGYQQTNYIVFEFESKDRIELIVPKEDFNLIFEGERGTLTFQGRKFLKFDRFTN